MKEVKFRCPRCNSEITKMDSGHYYCGRCHTARRLDQIICSTCMTPMIKVYLHGKSKSRLHVPVCPSCLDYSKIKFCQYSDNGYCVKKGVVCTGVRLPLNYIPSHMCKECSNTPPYFVQFYKKGKLITDDDWCKDQVIKYINNQRLEDYVRMQFVFTDYHIKEMKYQVHQIGK